MNILPPPCDLKDFVGTLQGISHGNDRFFARCNLLLGRWQLELNEILVEVILFCLSAPFFAHLSCVNLGNHSSGVETVQESNEM